MGIPLVLSYWLYELHIEYILSRNLKEAYAWITSANVL